MCHNDFLFSLENIPRLQIANPGRQLRVKSEYNLNRATEQITVVYEILSTIVLDLNLRTVDVKLSLDEHGCFIKEKYKDTYKEINLLNIGPANI